MGRSKITLRGCDPTLQGLQWEFDGPFRIGRNPNSDLVLSDASVGPAHAEVRPAPVGWMVRDLGSAQGTFVNGIRVDRTGRKLQPQDMLHCGQLGLQVAAAEVEVRVPTPSKGASSCLKTSGAFVTIEAVAQQSWEQGVAGLSRHDERLEQGKHFLTLLRGSYHLARITSLDEMLESVIEDTVAVLGARRGVFVLKDPLTGQLGPRALALSPEVTPLPGGKSFSHTLVQRCFTLGQSLFCRDVAGDPALETAQGLTGGAEASIICALVRSPRQRLGVLYLDRDPRQEPFTQDQFHLADAIAASIAVGIESAQWVEGQRRLFLQEIATLARQALEGRDPATAAHGRRVAAYSLLLAEALRLSPGDCHQLQLGAAFHDIGKIALPDAILRKPGPLTPEEFQEMKSHPLKGAALVEPISHLAPAIPIIRHHHERWDGLGYPDGLAGDKIPFLARLVAVAEAFDAMTSDQPYRRRLPREAAFAELRDKAGSQFDPQCVWAFLEIRPQIEALLP